MESCYFWNYFDEFRGKNRLGIWLDFNMPLFLGNFPLFGHQRNLAMRKLLLLLLQLSLPCPPTLSLQKNPTWNYNPIRLSFGDPQYSRHPESVHLTLEVWLWKWPLKSVRNLLLLLISWLIYRSEWRSRWVGPFDHLAPTSPFGSAVLFLLLQSMI